MIVSIQLSPRSLRLTSHRVSWPVAWMTSKLQKPSQSWKKGDDHRRTLSHRLMVAVSRTPPGPKIHSRNDEWFSFVIFIFRRTHDLSPSGSTGNLPSTQRSRPGIMNHCATRMSWTNVHRKRECSGVAILRSELKK